MSVGRVMRRIATLQASGVVYFDVDIAVAAMGHPITATLWLKVAPAHLHAVGEAIAEHDEVQFAAATTGPFNFVAAVTCADLDDLYSYVTTKIGKLSGVYDFELSPVLRRIKQAGAMTAGDRLAEPTMPARRAR
jgi:DNA-binding Lrp family transcriptional regulator